MQIIPTGTDLPPSAPLTGPAVWAAADVGRGDWLKPIPPACLAEIDRFVATLRRNPMRIELLGQEDYALDACREFMAGTVRGTLDDGVGFAVLDRLPVDRYSKEEMKAVYWVLSSMLARPVAQSFDGRLLYDVRDVGVKMDTRVRGDLTNQDLSWHTDYGFNFPPPTIGLLVLRTAQSGGLSSVSSFLTAHEELARTRPNLLARLYRPFVWNRQGEHPEDDPIVHRYPVFWRHDGRVKARFVKWLLYKGYELVGEDFDALGREAIETLFDTLSLPGHRVDFTLEAGQIQFLNNMAVAHCRTEYVDWPDEDRRRHLVRIFLRDGGLRSYMG